MLDYLFHVLYADGEDDADQAPDGTPGDNNTPERQALDDAVDAFNQHKNDLDAANEAYKNDASQDNYDKAAEEYAHAEAARQAAEDAAAAYKTAEEQRADDYAREEQARYEEAQNAHNQAEQIRDSLYQQYVDAVAAIANGVVDESLDFGEWQEQYEAEVARYQQDLIAQQNAFDVAEQSRADAVNAQIEFVKSLQTDTEDYFAFIRAEFENVDEHATDEYSVFLREEAARIDTFEALEAGRSEQHHAVQEAINNLKNGIVDTTTDFGEYKDEYDTAVSVYHEFSAAQDFLNALQDRINDDISTIDLINNGNFSTDPDDYRGIDSAGNAYDYWTDIEAAMAARDAGFSYNADGADQVSIYNSASRELSAVLDGLLNSKTQADVKDASFFDAFYDVIAQLTHDGLAEEAANLTDGLQQAIAQNTALQQNINFNAALDLMTVGKGDLTTDNAAAVNAIDFTDADTYGAENLAALKSAVNTFNQTLMDNNAWNDQYNAYEDARVVLESALKAIQSAVDITPEDGYTGADLDVSVTITDAFFTMSDEDLITTYGVHHAALLRTAIDEVNLQNNLLKCNQIYNNAVNILKNMDNTDHTDSDVSSVISGADAAFLAEHNSALADQLNAQMNGWDAADNANTVINDYNDAIAIINNAIAAAKISGGKIDIPDAVLKYIENNTTVGEDGLTIAQAVDHVNAENLKFEQKEAYISALNALTDATDAEAVNLIFDDDYGDWADALDAAIQSRMDVVNTNADIAAKYDMYSEHVELLKDMIASNNNIDTIKESLATIKTLLDNPNVFDLLGEDGESVDNSWYNELKDAYDSLSEQVRINDQIIAYNAAISFLNGEVGANDFDRAADFDAVYGDNAQLLKDAIAQWDRVHDLQTWKANYDDALAVLKGEKEGSVDLSKDYGGSGNEVGQWLDELLTTIQDGNNIKYNQNQLEEFNRVLNILKTMQEINVQMTDLDHVLSGDIVGTNDGIFNTGGIDWINKLQDVIDAYNEHMTQQLEMETAYKLSLNIDRYSMVDGKLIKDENGALDINGAPLKEYTGTKMEQYNDALADWKESLRAYFNNDLDGDGTDDGDAFDFDAAWIKYETELEAKLEKYTQDGLDHAAALAKYKEEQSQYDQNLANWQAWLDKNFNYKTDTEGHVVQGTVTTKSGAAIESTRVENSSAASSNLNGNFSEQLAPGVTLYRAGDGTFHLKADAGANQGVFTVTLKDGGRYTAYTFVVSGEGDYALQYDHDGKPGTPDQYLNQSNSSGFGVLSKSFDGPPVFGLTPPEDPGDFTFLNDRPDINFTPAYFTMDELMMSFNQNYVEATAEDFIPVGKETLNTLDYHFEDPDPVYDTWSQTDVSYVLMPPSMMDAELMTFVTSYETFTYGGATEFDPGTLDGTSFDPDSVIFNGDGFTFIEGYFDPATWSFTPVDLPDGLFDFDGGQFEYGMYEFEPGNFVPGMFNPVVQDFIPGVFNFETGVFEEGIPALVLDPIVPPDEFIPPPPVDPVPDPVLPSVDDNQPADDGDNDDALTNPPSVTINDADVPLTQSPDITMDDPDVPLADTPQTQDLPTASEDGTDNISMDDQDVPLGDFPADEEVQTMVIVDEDVPLSVAMPQTGVESLGMFFTGGIMLSALIAAMVAKSIHKYQKEHDE